MNKPMIVMSIRTNTSKLIVTRYDSRVNYPLLERKEYQYPNLTGATRRRLSRLANQFEHIVYLEWDGTTVEIYNQRMEGDN